MKTPRLRFRIATLMFLVTACAVAFAFSRPFDPQVEFSISTAGFYFEGDESGIPYCNVSVTNKGLQPIWFSGRNGVIETFEYYCDPTDNELENYNSSLQRSVQYSMLCRGQTATATVPYHQEYTIGRMGVPFRDWRGRAADVWSDDYPMPATP